MVFPLQSGNGLTYQHWNTFNHNELAGQSFTHNIVMHDCTSATPTVSLKWACYCSRKNCNYLLQQAVFKCLWHVHV